MDVKYSIDSDNVFIRSDAILQFSRAHDLYKKYFKKEPNHIRLIHCDGPINIYEVDDKILKIHPKSGYEASVIRYLNKEGFSLAPKLYFYGDDHMFIQKIEGETMFEAYDKMSPEQINMIFSQLNSAIGILKQKNVTHGDLMPTNIMVCGDKLVGIIDWERSIVGSLDDVERRGFMKAEHMGFAWWSEKMSQLDNLNK
ncbi:hypothetical protein DL89DRAFT_130955 [Linderina pennispora]|uniref:Aminoglycoside phosphotransferase domain-containing protein n=1 Tax=Linderina pennispora TaxID=61395 RepID=A0A1Y1VV56_9FUNG|nr:uncharacterized protein DL89DRAFT_130955 [Linderina pennispora]ORX65181.1 hypothetical protein DL89DRAFT_130955 [Linderina pennispora]